MLRFAVAAAVIVLAASPAAADGVHAELLTGYDGVTFGGNTYGGVSYGVGLGAEVTVAGRVYVGAEGTATGSTAKSSRLSVKARRDLAAVAKIGVGITENISLYALGGYSNALVKGPGGAEKLDGIRAGLGWRYKLGQVYMKGEFLYTNYEQGVKRYQGIAGLGYEF